MSMLPKNSTLYRMAAAERDPIRSSEGVWSTSKKRETLLIRFLSLTDALCIKYGVKYEVPFIFWTKVHEAYVQSADYDVSGHREIWKDVLRVSQELCDQIIYDKASRNAPTCQSYLAMPVQIIKLLNLD